MKHNKHLGNLLLAIAILAPGIMQAQQLLRNPSGMNLIATGDVKLVFSDAGFDNNGRFIAGNSTVLFNGNNTTLPALISGNSTLSFYHLVINRSTGLQLDNNVAVSGQLMLNEGNLSLNNHTLDLGRTGSIIGEKNSARIMDEHGSGQVKATAILNAPQHVNPGNIGVTITSTANLGETVIIRGHSQQPGFYGKPAIRRYYDIAPATNRGLQATLTFHYLDAELDNNNESELSVFSKSGIAASWLSKGKDNNDAGTNWVTKTQLDQLHRFTLAKATATDRLQTAMEIFPNPSPGRFTVTVYSEMEKDAGIVLYDMAGRLLERKKVHCIQGANNVTWNISQYASGTYQLVFENLDDTKSVKIVKQ